MKSIAQIFEHNGREVIIAKIIALSKREANVYYSLIENGNIVKSDIIFHAKSPEEFIEAFVYTGHNIDIDID